MHKNLQRGIKAKSSWYIGGAQSLKLDSAGEWTQRGGAPSKNILHSTGGPQRRTKSLQRKKKKIQPSNTLLKALWCWVHSRNILILKWDSKPLPDCSRWSQRMCTKCILDFDNEKRRDRKTASLPQMSRSLTCRNSSNLTPTTPQQVLWRDNQFSKSIGAFTRWQQEGFTLYAQRRCLLQRHKKKKKKCTLRSKERHRERVMVGGCASTKENLFSRAVKEAESSKEKERATSRIVFQGVVCCIVTCFDCGVGTRFSPPQPGSKGKSSACVSAETIKEGERQAGKECENSRVT